MTAQTKIGRRTAGRLLAGAAAAATQLAGQAPQRPSATTVDTDLRDARDEQRAYGQQIASVKLPRATEPAFRFRV